MYSCLLCSLFIFLYYLVYFISCLLVHLVNLFNQLHAFNYLSFYCHLISPISLSSSTVFYPWRHPTGFQSYPAVCFPKRVTVETHFLPFWYIGWKPGRKFRGRIWMDGSAVCTRDTTPRTEMGLKCGLVFFTVLDPFLFILLVWATLLSFI